MMGGYDVLGVGAMGFGAVWMVLFWVLVIVAAALLLRRLLGSTPAVGAERGVRTPLGILGERYAKGAIGKEEFEQKRQDLTK